jgi:DNA polymerase-3 subunit delta
MQGLTPKAREVVEESLARPTPGVVLVLVGAIPSGSKSRFYENLISGALSVEFPALDPHDLPGWLVERARSEHGVEIDLDAARALSSAIGSSLGVLSTELDKAVAFAGDRKRLTLEDIKAVGGYIPRVDRFAWFDHVGNRDFGTALQQLPELLDSGEGAVWLIMGLTNHVLKLGLAVAGGQEGLDRALRSNQRWLANRLLPQARRWSSVQIDAALADLLRTDRLLKSASLSDRQAMEELLLRLMEASQSNPSGRRSRRPAQLT